MALHYGVGVIPARPRKPRDKAKVEVGVQIAQRWIVAALRYRRFFSVAQLNLAIGELLAKINQRPFRKRPPLTLALASTQPPIPLAHQ
jgi:transposase